MAAQAAIHDKYLQGRHVLVSEPVTADKTTKPPTHSLLKLAVDGRLRGHDEEMGDRAEHRSARSPGKT